MGEDLFDTLYRACGFHHRDKVNHGLLHDSKWVRFERELQKEDKRICKVIFENNHTIIVDNFGNRYISRPEQGEKFDEEKGLLVALAKYDGHSTSEILELLKGAVRKNAKQRKKTSKKNKV